MFDWRSHGPLPGLPARRHTAVAVCAVVGGAVLALAAAIDVIGGVMAREDARDAKHARLARVAEPAKAPRAHAGSLATAVPVKLINSGTASSAAIGMPDAAPASDGPTDDDDLDAAGSLADWYDLNRETFRTVCVRLCDGAIVPLSYATTRDKFGRDAKRCRASCGTETRLFVERNPPGDGGSGLVDLEGRPYTSLAQAYRFRTSVDPSCSCRPEAWEHASVARHRLYAARHRLAARRIAAASHIAALKQAASRGLRVAALTPPRPGPGSAQVVTMPPVSLPVSKTRPHVGEGAQRLGGLGEASGPVRPGDKAEEPRKITGSEEIESQAVTAKMRKAAASKSKKSAARKTKAIVVLFGPVIDGPVQKASVRAFVYRDAPPQRRFDGTDWRISAYEPL